MDDLNVFLINTKLSQSIYIHRWEPLPQTNPFSRKDIGAYTLYSSYRNDEYFDYQNKEGRPYTTR